MNFAKRALLESLYRDLIKRSSHDISHRDLVQEVLPRDLLEISCPGGLAKRLLKEICAERALVEILYTDLAKR